MKLSFSKKNLEKAKKVCCDAVGLCYLGDRKSYPIIIDKMNYYYINGNSKVSLKKDFVEKAIIGSKLGSINSKKKQENARNIAKLYCTKKNKKNT